MDVNKANKWWEKAMKKQELRESHHPKAPSKQPWTVPTRDSSFIKTEGRKVKRWIMKPTRMT